MFPRTDFVGPLDAAAQAWSDRVAEADRIAAAVEPAELVIARRQASIAELHRAAALLLLTGQERTAFAIAVGAIAEQRALSGYQAADAATCVDCLVFGNLCARHAEGTDSGQHSWHRFGS